MARDLTKPTSDENVTVVDTTFSDIPVRLYLPRRKAERLRPAVIFFHGGAFVLGSCKLLGYDMLNRWTADKVDAIVVGVDYRLAPKYKFPVSHEDTLSVVKFFLQDKILAKYGVDPARICITGDSSGGVLATMVARQQPQIQSQEVSPQGVFSTEKKQAISRTTVAEQCGGQRESQLKFEPEFKDKIKAQALIYPGLQVLDTFLPSYLEYEQGPVLPRYMVIRLISLYVNNDAALYPAMLKNEHLPPGSRHLLKFVNWSTLLPEKYKKNHVYTEPIVGKLKISYPELSDIRISPLLWNDSVLQILPLTYILTCQHDILRDDGLMYVIRLRNAGVQVTHDHIENGIHGALSLTGAPFHLKLGFRLRDRYISWLQKNL
ncbi:arylacetamide deacetylase-like 2 [Ctenodactylus gundi]